MKVLLVKDVYKLGRAGDIKKVADGFGRNFLIPQGFAVLATEGAMKQVQKILVSISVEQAKTLLPNRYTGFVPATHASYASIENAGIAVGKIKPKS